MENWYTKVPSNGIGGRRDSSSPDEYGGVACQYRSRSAPSFSYAERTIMTPIKRLISLAVFALMAACLVLPAKADFATVDLEKIPVERLVTNLQDLAQKKPKDVQILTN